MTAFPHPGATVTINAAGDTGCTVACMSCGGQTPNPGQTCVSPHGWETFASLLQHGGQKEGQSQTCQHGLHCLKNWTLPQCMAFGVGALKQHRQNPGALFHGREHPVLMPRMIRSQLPEAHEGMCASMDPSPWAHPEGTA